MGNGEQQKKENNLEGLKKNQQLLKDQLKQLEEGIASPKAYSFQTEEIREMVQNLLTQNKRLAEKVDYLLSILVEASSELSDDVFDKTLAAMGKSQLDMMDQLSTIKEKLEAGKTKEDELQKMYQSTEQKLKSISDAVSQLSYAKQLDDLKANVGTISSDIQKLGGVITSEAPELKENIDSLKTELDDLKQNVSELGMFRSEIKEVETKLAEVESILNRQQKKAVAELSAADKQTLRQLTQDIHSMNTEIRKMEKALETYPSSDAQQITVIRQKLDALETTLSSIKQTPHQEGVAQELSGLRAKINSIEKLFAEKELDMERKREAEMQVITELLKKIENDLTSLGGQQATQLSQVLSDLSEKTKQLSDSLQKTDLQTATPRHFEELKNEISGLGMRLGRIEEYVKKEKVVDSSHVSDIRTELRAVRRELEGMRGVKVKPEVISKVRENVSRLEMPAAKVIGPREKERINSIRADISRSKEFIRPMPPAHVREVKKGLQTAEEKVNSIMKEINKTEDSVIEKREAIKKLRSEVLGAPLRHEDVIGNYVSKLSPEVPVKVRDIAGILNMDAKEVLRVLLKTRKESPGRIELKNTGYLSRLLGREPILLIK